MVSERIDYLDAGFESAGVRERVQRRGLRGFQRLSANLPLILHDVYSLQAVEASR